MKKILIYALVALGMTFTLSSCEGLFGNFLDKEPSNDLTEEQVFSNWALMEYFHWNTYSYITNGFGRIDNSWLDAATDLGETSFGTGGARQSFNLGNYYSEAGDAELIDVWDNAYEAIRKANTILTRIDQVPKAADLTDALYQTYKAQYKAEAHYFRAYAYWQMFLRYGPVPIIETPLNPEGDLLSGYTTRPTLKTYIDYILNELAIAEPDVMAFNASYERRNSTYTSRIIKPTVSALKSRIMLYMASPRYSAESGVTWEQALAATNDFINKYGSIYSLFNNGVTNIQKLTNVWLFTPYENSNTETIIYRNAGTSSWGAVSYDVPVGDGGRGGMCPSQNLVDMFDMADGSAPFTEYDETGAPVYDANGNPTINTASGYTEQKMWENRDPRLAAAILYQGVQWGNNVGPIDVREGMKDNPAGNADATPTGYYLRKYIPETIINNNHVGSVRRVFAIMRYAEILLNKAEILNEIEGPTAEVCDLLDQVRHRAGITGNVADRADLKTKEAMRNFIRKERTVEFCFEEQRFWDVKRWNVAEEALGRPIYGVNVAQDGTISRKVAQKRVFEPKMYLYPIPQSEVWKTNIANNPGWNN